MNSNLRINLLRRLWVFPIAAISLLYPATESVGQTVYDWLDTAPDGNWRQGAGGARWNPGGLWDQPPFGVLRFNNNHQLAMTNNVPGTYSMHGVIFGSSNTNSRSLSGNTLRLFDNGGADPYIENASSATHFINLNLEGDGTVGDPLSIRLNSTGGLTINGTINNQGSFVDVVGSTGSAVTARFNGAISGGGGFFKDNGATTAILAANNSYSGITNLAGGTLQVGAGGTTGTLGSGQLELNGSSNTTLRLSRSDAPTISNTVVLGGASGNRFIEVDGANSATLSGQVTSSARELWKTGTGTLILSNASNSVNASIVVSGGTLEVTNIGAVGGTGNVFIGAGNLTSTFAYSGSSNATTAKLGANALQATGTNSTIAVTGAGSLTVTSAIGGLGAGDGLTKAGAGTLILTGANTYSGGTVVSQGTLIVNGSLANAGAVSVASGATLSGNGTIGGATTIQAGGNLNPGNSPGLLTFNGTLTLSANSTTNIEINGAGRGTDFDAINVGSSLTYGGSLNLLFGFTPVLNQTFDIFDFTGQSGTFTSITPTFLDAGYGGSFNYTNGTFTVTAVPEIGTWAVVFLSAGALAAMRKKRRIAA